MSRRIGFAACLLALVNVAILAAQANDAWSAVRTVLERPGKVEAGILRLTYPRDDLGGVRIGGDPVDPGLVYESWFGFMGRGATTMMMGDFCVTEKELPAVEAFVITQGFSVNAVHNHVIDESRRMMFMHVSARGNPQSLATTIKRALALTTTPTGKESPEKAARTDWGPAERVLGKPDEVEGPKVEFIFPRAGRITVGRMTVPSTSAFETADEAAFQMVGNGRAVAYAEFLVQPDELDATLRTFAASGFVVQAVHNHMTTDQPRFLFIHAWGTGDLGKLALAVSAALKESDTQFRRAQH